jgi:pilus assembly protein Flp/PilA
MPKASFSRFEQDDRGATAIEYALIAGIISLAIVAGVTNISLGVQSDLNGVAPTLTAGK